MLAGNHQGACVMTGAGRALVMGLQTEGSGGETRKRSQHGHAQQDPQHGHPRDASSILRVHCDRFALPLRSFPDSNTLNKDQQTY